MPHSAADNDSTLAYTLSFQLTEPIHREVYDQVSPTSPLNSASGRIIVITGGDTGIGAVSTHLCSHTLLAPLD